MHEKEATRVNILLVFAFVTLSCICPITCNSYEMIVTFKNIHARDIDQLSLTSNNVVSILLTVIDAMIAIEKKQQLKVQIKCKSYVHV